ncbi:hypothetical protein BE21_55105 [Sorangium cellulosum]|uniref:MalT-like TPR region domain-containing protein n=1 Tax=Sorangium cellulosum TaxID=56 RepID=A0A150TCE3_SORCE|nr:hypothetical protein BE21_55105 [Sorangium cellulosum]
MLRAQGDLAGARDAFERSSNILAKVHGTEEHADVAASLYELGGVLTAQNDLTGARQALERSSNILAKVHGTEEHADVAALLCHRAAILEAEGQLEQAATSYRGVLAIQEKYYGTLDQCHSAAIEVALAMLLVRLDREDEACELLSHAVGVLIEQVPNHPFLEQLRALTLEQPG